MRRGSAARSPLRYETLTSCSSHGKDVYDSIRHAARREDRNRHRELPSSDQRRDELGASHPGALPGIAVTRPWSSRRATDRPSTRARRWCASPPCRCRCTGRSRSPLPTRQVENALRDFQSRRRASRVAGGVVRAWARSPRSGSTCPRSRCSRATWPRSSVATASASRAPSLWSWLRWIHRHAALTLAPSSVVAWELEQRGFAPVARWSRGVDVDRFNPAHRSELMRRHIAPRGEVVVGYVGRLAAEKQVERLAAPGRPARHTTRHRGRRPACVRGSSDG